MLWNILVAPKQTWSSMGRRVVAWFILTRFKPLDSSCADVRYSTKFPSEATLQVLYTADVGISQLLSRPNSSSRCPRFPIIPFMLQGRHHHPCNGDRFSEITTCGMNSSESRLESVGQIFVFCQILSTIVRLSVQYPCRIWDGCGNTECFLWIQSEIDNFDTTKGVSFTATFVIIFPGQSAISRNFAVKLSSAKVVNWTRKL